MKTIFLGLLIMCCKKVAIEDQKVYKFEPSLLSCQKSEISDLLSNGKCVYHFKQPGYSFLCKFLCDTEGQVRLKECRLNTNYITKPLCDDLYCVPGKEVAIVTDQCELITNWQSSLLCSYECDDRYRRVRFKECNSNFMKKQVPLCEHVYCTSKNKDITL